MDRRVFVPLTHAEKRIYLTQQLHPESCLWNVPVSLRVTMADPDRLHRALLHVIQQTPGMRVVFTNKNGEPCKYLSQDIEPRVDRLDFTREGEQSYLDWANQQAETPLPMLDCLPYRLAIADVGDGTSYLFTNYHHIAADGGASDLVLRLVLQAYETLGTGGTPKFSDPLPPSAAFDSEQKYFRSEQFEADKEYWNTLFEAVPDPMDIAGRPAPKTLTMERMLHRFSTSVSKSLLEYCKQSKVSVFRVVLAAMSVVLSRTLRREDLVLGTATANRHPRRLHKAFGMHVSTCAMRMQVDGEATFEQLVRDAGRCVQDTIAHERYPYDVLTSDLRSSGNEIPDLISCTLVEMVRTPYPDYAEAIVHHPGESLIPLSGFLTFPRRNNPKDTKVELLMVYNKEMYEPWRIQALINHLEQAVAEGVRAPETQVRDLNFLSSGERQDLVHVFNENYSDWEIDTTLHDSIAATTRRHPGRTAVVHRGSSLTYAELDARANAMARTLFKHGARPGKVIGLLADRSIDIIVAQLAILKSGCAFMPIDTGYPDSRIQYMLEDIQAPVILTQQQFMKGRDFGGAVLLDMDDLSIFASDNSAFESGVSPHDPCVVLYTSGSTGKPKGVVLEHRSICNTINATIRNHGITFEDRISKHAGFSFDASLLEVFTALMSGAALHVIPEEIRLSLSHLNEYFERNGITWAFLTTQLGEQFMEFMDNNSLHTLAIGGEKMRIFKPRNYRLLNVYGPTECSIYATQHHVTRYEDNLPIGRPVPNFRIYILDDYDHPQPPGYAGELCISGPGVARGYHMREDKNAECFVPDVFHSGKTMYRTGDLACWTPEGTLLHLGRMDRQVKLRGFRIELGEIENAMLAVEGVAEAAVADFQDTAGHVYLCGYVCGNVEPDAVKQGLKDRIPDFMVPAHMVRLDAMPINPSGKIDRKKLPEPKEQEATETTYAAPENDLEARLCKVWGYVLDQERVSAEANFFQSGGDSLRAVSLQLTIGRELGCEVDLGAIFECPTPRLMASRLESGGSTNGITPAEPTETYPTMVSQQQLYLLNRMKGIGTTYNMPLCLTFKGNLDQKRLSDSLLILLDRHESLRTAFELREGRCVQRVKENVHLKLDYSQTASNDPAEFAADFVRPFDLSHPPLMHAKLLAHPDGRHSLLLDFHHIAFDGVSVGIFLRELFSLYQGEELPPAPIQPKDVAAWLAMREDEILADHEKFWRDLFDSAPESELPTDFPRPGHQDFSGETYHHRLNREESLSLRRFAREQGATLHQIILGAIGVLAGRWSDSEDICLGTSMSGRERAETAGIVGMFVRTLPTRIRPGNDKTFSELLSEIRDQMRGIHEHGEYPISRLYEYLGANRGPGRHPMFDINFVMRNVGADDRFELEGLCADVHPLHLGTAKFDLSIAAEEHGEEIVFEMDYRTSLYRRETIARMAGHLSSILSSITKEPGRPVGEIDMLCPEERNALLRQFNPHPTPGPSWNTVCRAVEIHAAARPDKIAVTAEDGTFTYAELNRLANRAARAIAEAGGGKDRIVAVVADRSIWSVCGMLAALKSGSAYVGLDTNYPPDRMAFILEDTNAPCVVGSAEQLAGIGYDCAGIALDGNLPEDDSDPGLAEGGNALAYCIFTSGSTGTPKGVLIEHCSMVNFIHWYATHHCMTPEANCAAFAAFSFDVSVVQVFAPLASGSTLHVIAEDLRRSPKDLDAYFKAHNVTHAHFPTQFAEQYMRLCGMESLRHLVVGGDRLKSYRLGTYRLTNEYGPSEATMACLSYDVSEIMPQPPVGKPVANTAVSILDSRGRLCPIGVPGEICVSGVQVGRGYLNRPELTKKHFTEDPLRPGERMFRTGDKGKWLEDGTVDFIGRMDFQVKIRGYRVEPGEIEARIKEYDSVLDCVVVPLEDPSGNKVLAAYCTAVDQLEVDTLKSGLPAKLPEYMVPAHFVQLESLPLNPNGKVDRGKLPRPEITSAAKGPLEPRNPKEARIVQAWETVLGHRGFGLFDSFFDIGGDSLSAIALLADLSETFDISASDLFAHTTIADQAQHFQEAEIGRSTRLLRLKQLAAPPEEDTTFQARLAEYEAACEADTELDVDTVKPLEHVLLTGATGTLGIYLLRELLHTTKARVTAVIRSENNEAAHRRLSDHYADRFGRTLEADANARVEVLAGDLSIKDFGMEKSVSTRLEEDVDTILNSAALTSHYGDWNVFKNANVTSVENLAEFARRGRPKAMHHISTTSIGAGRIKGCTKALFTEFDVDRGQESGNLYVRSKLLAEIALQKLREEGLPVTIHRAGNITCDSETGMFQRNVDDNGFYQQLRAYVNLGAAPDFTDQRNMSYVDQSARAIVTVMTRPGLTGQTLHIQNPTPLSLSAALGNGSLGLRLKRLDFESFIEFFAEHSGRTGFDEYVERLLLHLGWQDWLSDPARTSTVIKVDRSAKLLERCGFTWKTPHPRDLKQFVRHALQDRVRLLKTIPGFSTLSDEALTDIASRIKPEHFAETMLLQQENRPVDGIRFIMEGMAETYRHNSNGWVGTIRVSGPGSCMGEESVLQDNVAANSVESLDDSFVFQLSLDDVRSLIGRHPQLGPALLHLASIKTNQAERLFVAV